nr:MAG TPA: hypothetical protein [Caudoviricetes sp.]
MRRWLIKILREGEILPFFLLSREKGVNYGRT